MRDQVIGTYVVPLVAGLFVLKILLVLLVRPRLRALLGRSVKASPDERRRTLPGDALIAESIGSLTHAVTIRSSPDNVWPWLVQMGAGSRAGWYSYDFLDNGGQPSADQIMPELQNIAPGTLFPALPGATEGFILASCEAERVLVIGWPSADGSWLMTWAFVLEQTEHGATRLIARARGGRGYHFHGMPWWLAQYAVRLIHGIMQRKQLLGIARRVEQSPQIARSLQETMEAA